VHDMGRFFRALCQKMGLDIFLITHNTALFQAAEKRYRAKKVNDWVVFEQVMGKK